jgi:alanyl-tRNA synthetase
MALFGEKYGDHVRAIKFGESMELCGGIHVKNTKSGILKSFQKELLQRRRIEAITGDSSNFLLRRKMH